MFSKFKKLLAFGVAAVIAGPGVAFAQGTVSHYTGSWEGINVKYNPHTENFAMDYRNNNNINRDDINSFWLVVTDGPMPNGTGIQLIGDKTTGKMAVYEYVMGAGSSADNYEVGRFLGSEDFNNLEDGFELDMTKYNEALEAIDATGSKFEIDGEAAGIWMKGGNGTPEFNDDGSIKEWKTGDGNYHIFDKHNLGTETHYQNTGVSEPEALLVMLSAAGLMRLRKKKNS